MPNGLVVRSFAAADDMCGEPTERTRQGASHRRMGFEPVAQCGIHACLPSRTGSAECRQNIFIESGAD